MNLPAHPLKLAVLGDPLDHSLSPVIQQAALSYAGIEGTYTKRRVDGEGVKAAVSEIRSGELTGVNVTMPHKRLAASLVDRLEGDAVRMAAANTLWGEDGVVVGASTDPDGVRWAWDRARLPTDGPVLILGAGGAAAAAIVGLEERMVGISARRPDAAEQLVAALESDAWTVPWGVGLVGAVVVNATPVGMGGEELPPQVLAEASGLLEMTYGPIISPAAEAMRARSLPVASGQLMLVGQGIASFKLWTGISVPPEVMLDAISAARPDPGQSV